MARARPIHSAHRALTDITVGAVKATRARDALRAELGLEETDQQFQFAISGAASTLPSFTIITVTFDFPFHYAPGQRDSDLEDPQMSFGGQVDNAVMVNALVKDWVIDADNGSYLGATVWVSVLAAAESTDFTGTIHVTFEGMSAPDEVDFNVGET